MYSCLQPWLSKVPFSALYSIFMKNFAVYFYYLFFIRAKRKRVKRGSHGSQTYSGTLVLAITETFIG